ncbi:hypothetical protein SPRG_03126 [Saprolegnia parasitica CBS 223.65]|uniref:ubiquitinyl hydrolase 1 n=1 Tax=Saprolegnia parasitica (strain CBS 223.65) TaxID=695850 RepID=A0A067CRN1_SAPPC|nr:hypothetical protein SPRG_03126 [Saprolegnia parasitica CBS 223.65]KDO31910.1 hypothetical protein SPRG_03126 [Saprolegnia parasitica CBS 223.65]|eukprot:XP_012197109.1 hypothetical protein SPRG_03126 [Saprolegnia parasitica CBS 223.65]
MCKHVARWAGEASSRRCVVRGTERLDLYTASPSATWRLTDEISVCLADGCDFVGPLGAMHTASFSQHAFLHQHPIARGLLNMGHTCYMNAILQAMCHLALLPPTALEPAGRCRDHLCLPCRFHDLAVEMRAPEASPLAPSTLLYAMWQHAPHLAGCQQQDAHEFLLGLLDGLHSTTSEVECNA